MLPEGPVSADEVLPEARLGLVDAKRRRLAHRRAEVLRVEALLVQGVAHFVQDAEEPVVETVAVVARGDAAIAGTNGAEKRVGGRVQSATFEIETESGGHRFAEGPLPVRREGTPKDPAVGFAPVCGEGRDQRQQLAPKGLKQLGDVLVPGSGLEFMEQGIIRNGLVAEALGLATFQGYDLLQPGAEASKVGLLMGDGPLVLGKG